MKEPKYPTRVCKSLGEWWKNYILPQQNEDMEEHANVAFMDELQTMNEAIYGGNVSK